MIGFQQWYVHHGRYAGQRHSSSLVLCLLQIHPLPRPIPSDEQVDVSTVRPCRADADILVLVLTVLVLIGGENDASRPIPRGTFLEGNDVGLGAQYLITEPDFYLAEIARRGWIAIGICGGQGSRCSSILAVMAEDGT